MTNIDFFFKNDIDEECFSSIKKNIKKVLNELSIYRNILFVCSDYPGYGGSATNCYELQKYFKSIGHNTYGIYYCPGLNINRIYKDYIVTNNYNVFRYINFNPDLIILKSALGINLKKIFFCPIFFFIGGIYTDKLNKYHTQLTYNEQLKFVNHVCLRQINLYDKSYVNSYHTKKILKNIFNIETFIFYTSFISFLDKEIFLDSNFENRKYNYGLIVSNFERLIKNTNKSINFLKDKDNVIIIGKNSEKYKNYGFKILDLMDHKYISKEMRNIKYIVQDSFYESCSNVKIEAIFNGCKMIDNYKKSILVSSTHYPGYGGAATNAYNIIKYLRNHNYNVIGLFFNERTDVNYDPDNIGGIFLFHWYNININNIRSIIKKYTKQEIDICLTKGEVSPVYCRKLFPNSYVYYLCSGINYFLNGNCSAIEFLKNTYKINKRLLTSKNTFNINSYDTIVSSDYVICNSNLTIDIFKKLYPNFLEKLYNKYIDTSYEVIQFKKNINVNEKIYDIIIVCSNYNRKQKNIKLIYELLNDKKMNNYKKIVIGKNSNIFKNICNCTILDILSYNEIQYYFSKSKITLLTSYFDSNPNTSKEAIFNNCLPIISKNIGCYELFPEYLVCESLNITEWMEKLSYLLNNYNYLISKTKIDFKSKTLVSIL